jgi:hypothetical protein
MTAKDVLELNGDFCNSPLLDTARKPHRLLMEEQIPYAIIGGLAGIRNGGVNRETGVPVEFLYTGDDRDMTGPLPDPVQQKRDEGMEIAAKDLADVVELLKNNLRKRRSG